jgi:hypothetical protein
MVSLVLITYITNVFVALKICTLQSHKNKRRGEKVPFNIRNFSVVFDAYISEKVIDST